MLKRYSSVVTRSYVTRLVDPLIDALLAEVPAIMLVGPRAVGKTTTASSFASTVVRLDREAEAVAFRADPDAALRGLPEPVLLDEWQAVPGVLGAVKRAVDDDPRPGRYLVTGSVRADLEAETWPGTGRLVRIPMYGLTVRETSGDAAARPFLDRLLDEGPNSPRLPAERPDLRGYVELALRSGFPEAALNLADTARPRWIESYVDQLLTRDAALAAGGRDPDRLHRYFEALALNTAGVTDDKSLYDLAGVNRRTAEAYEQLFRNLMVLDVLPAWTTNRLKRLVRRPKRHVVDPALVAGVLGVGVAGVLRDGDLLGRILESFVAAQLRAETPVSEARPRYYHLRQVEGRHEVDLVAELGAQAVVGIEVKADAAPGAAAATHLAWLRDQLGDRFACGVLLHTGPRAFRISERIVAVPICALWG